MLGVGSSMWTAYAVVLFGNHMNWRSPKIECKSERKSEILISLRRLAGLRGLLAFHIDMELKRNHSTSCGGQM